MKREKVGQLQLDFIKRGVSRESVTARELSELKKRGGERLKELVKRGGETMPEGRELKRVRDYYPDQLDTDSWLHVKDVLNKDLEILEVETRTGDKGEFIVVKTREPGEKVTIGFSCGGAVVVRKLLELKAQGRLPILGKIVEIEGGAYDRYYDII